MGTRSTSASVLAAIGRNTLATAAVCGAFVGITLISFTAALIGWVRPATGRFDL